jgi:hypothetical protein
MQDEQQLGSEQDPTLKHVIQQFNDGAEDDKILRDLRPQGYAEADARRMLQEAERIFEGLPEATNDRRNERVASAPPSRALAWYWTPGMLDRGFLRCVSRVRRMSGRDGREPAPCMIARCHRRQTAREWIGAGPVDHRCGYSSAAPIGPNCSALWLSEQQVSIGEYHLGNRGTPKEDQMVGQTQQAALQPASAWRRFFDLVIDSIVF